MAAMRHADWRKKVTGIICCVTPRPTAAKLDVRQTDMKETKMNTINRIATALFTAGALSFAAPVLAQDISYPRVVGTGENASIDYGPGPVQNILGGGAVTTQDFADGSVRINHLEPRFAQPGREGVRAVTVGTGESQRTVWVPVNDAVNAATLNLNATRG
jgi:hypothetical protein